MTLIISVIKTSIIIIKFYSNAYDNESKVHKMNIMPPSCIQNKTSIDDRNYEKNPTNNSIQPT